MPAVTLLGRCFPLHPLCLCFSNFCYPGIPDLTSSLWGFWFVKLFMQISMTLQGLSKNVVFTCCRCNLSSVSLRRSEILVLTNKGSDEEEGDGKKRCFLHWSFFNLVLEQAQLTLRQACSSAGAQHHVLQHHLFLMHMLSCPPPALLLYGLTRAKGLGRDRLTSLGASGQSREESTPFSHPTVHLSVTTMGALSLISVIVPVRSVTHPNPGSSPVQW